MKERLDKVLAHLGVGSRKEIARLARAGLIALDGKTVRDSSFKFDPSTARIEIDGEEVIYRRFFYVLLNKPAGYVTSTKDRDGQPVTELLEDARDDWMPVGRLDKDTEGLLLLTNHGELVHRLTHPRWKIDKRYYAELESPATEADVAAFAAGLELEGEPLRSADLRISPDPRRIELVIQEGKFHQVKRMFAARGNRVVYLRRIAFGPLELPADLATGESRPLSEAELLGLYATVGLTVPDGA
jgi:16S rRNA pseudouridine516 synthase